MRKEKKGEPLLGASLINTSGLKLSKVSEMVGPVSQRIAYRCRVSIIEPVSYLVKRSSLLTFSISSIGWTRRMSAEVRRCTGQANLQFLLHRYNIHRIRHPHDPVRGNGRSATRLVIFQSEYSSCKVVMFTSCLALRISRW